MIHTPVCDLLGIRHPVLQAGMGIYTGVVTTPVGVPNAHDGGNLRKTLIHDDDS